MSEVNAMEFDASASNAESVDWDSIEETAPSMEEANNDAIEVEEIFDNEESSNVSEVSGASDSSEEEGESSDEQSDLEATDGESEDSSEDATEAEGDEEEAENSFELSEQLQEKGLTSQEGEVGKMVTIDGEEKFVSLEELGNDYSGQEALSKRFTELDQSKKEHQEDVSQVEAYITEFGDKMRNGDAVGAFSYFGQFAGIPPYMVKEQLIAALAPEIQRRGELTNAELQNEYLNEQNSYLQKQNESESKRRESEQANMDLTQSINSVRETQGISESEWSEAVSYLQEQDIDQNQLTPEAVGNYVQNVRAYDKAEGILTGMEVPLEGNDSFIDTFQKIIVDNPDFTEDDLKNLVEQSKTQLQQEEVKKELKQKIAKGQPKKEPKKQEVKQQESQFTELDDDWESIL